MPAEPAAAGLPGVDPALTAYQLDALLCATNTSLPLGDPDAVPRLVAMLLTPPAGCG